MDLAAAISYAFQDDKPTIPKHILGHLGRLSNLLGELMTPLTSTFSVVVLGSWNRAIFSPAWVQRNLCDDGSSEVTIAIAADNFGAPPLLEFEGIRLILGDARLDLKPIHASVESLDRCAEVASKLCDLLPHTPVSAVGVNVGFSAGDDKELIEEKLPLFQLPDVDLLPGPVYASRLVRTFFLEDNVQLNYEVSLSNEGAVCSFNYHRECGASGVRQYFESHAASGRLKHAKEIMARYGLTFN